MRDYTPLEHLVIALVIMTAVGVFTDNWAAGACLGSGIFIGREHAQAEYRWMYMRKLCRTGAETLGAFNPKVWNLNSFMDVALPLRYAWPWRTFFNRN